MSTPESQTTHVQLIAIAGQSQPEECIYVNPSLVLVRAQSTPRSRPPVYYFTDPARMTCSCKGFNQRGKCRHVGAGIQAAMVGYGEVEEGKS